MMVDAWTPGVPFDAEWVMGTGFIVRHPVAHRRRAAGVAAKDAAGRHLAEAEVFA
jgi:hypothetical protein